MHNKAHRHFLAGVVFNYLEKNFGVGKLEHQAKQGKRQFDLFCKNLFFEKRSLKICLLVAADVRILTVFHEDKSIFQLTSALMYEPVLTEVQHLHNESQPPACFIEIICSVAEKEGKLEEIQGWPKMTAIRNVAVA